MKLLFVTSRRAKVEWAQATLKDYGIKLAQKPFDFSEIRSFDVAVIAKEKARQASKKIKRPFILTDDGFYIKALNGFPATQVNFAMQTIGIDGIVKMMKGVKDRRCEFRSALAYFDGKKIRLFVGAYKGKVAIKPRGTRGWGWGPLMRIWQPDGRNETVAELTRAEFERDKRERETGGPYIKFARWLRASGRI